MSYPARAEGLVNMIMVIGALTRCALFHSVLDSKVTRKMCNGLIRQLMLSKFKLGHTAAVATKTICFTEGEGPVDHIIVTEWFKEFPLGCKSLDGQARSGMPKIVDS